MTQSRIKDDLSYHTCLCSMCSCGDNKCFQQQASKLPLSLQKELVYESRDLSKEAGKKESTPQADLYRTTYKRDYCEAPDIIDRYPLEHINRDSLRLDWISGAPLDDSISKTDFIPYSYKDQIFYGANLFIPDKRFPELRIPELCYTEYWNPPSYPTQGKYNYYCPDHCLGTEKREERKNCLLGHEKQFILESNVRKTIGGRACSMFQKSPHPFAKYSDYMLEYRGCEVPPRKLGKPRDNIDLSPYPMSSKTIYKEEFTSPPEMSHHPRKKERQVASLKVGDGPMVKESTTMRDFGDLDVRTHAPVRQPASTSQSQVLLALPDEYKPPVCSMETTTETESTYKRWENLPVKPKRTSNDVDAFFKYRDPHVRRNITTYQVDFNGIASGVCPCRVVEKYGPRVLEPRYSYRKSNSLHDMFSFTNDSERSNIWPHG